MGFSGSVLILDFLGEWTWEISPKTQGDPTIKGESEIRVRGA